MGESTDEEADEDISASEVDEEKADLHSSPKGNDETEHSSPPASRSTVRRTSSMASPSPIKLARPQRTASATKRAILQQSASALSDDEAQDVLNYAQLPAARVTRRMLAGLSERGQRLYEQLRQAEQQPAAHSRTSPALPIPTHQAPQVSFSIGPDGQAHTAMQPPLSVAQPPPVWLPNARLSGRASHRFQPAGQDASDGEDGAPQVYEDGAKQQFVPSRRLRGVLQRLGVPDGSLCEMDALEVARAEVGGGSFEQWWQARAPSMRREGKSNQYYEGLVLSLILDNLDRLDVLAQIAARRWCVLNSTVTHNLSWDMAKALLPMSSAGAISTSLVYDMQKFAKAQKEMRATMYNTAERGSSGNYNTTGGVGSRRNNNKKQREADTKSGSGRENEAQSGSRKGRKNRSRNNLRGAGASSASGAEQE